MALVRNGPFRALARAARRSLYRLRARGIPVVYDARYQRGVFGVPMDPLRGEKVLGALREAGLLERDLLSEPRPASLQNLLRVHTPEYLHAVQEPEALSRVLGVEVPPAEVEATLDLQRLMAGGTIQATRLAMRTGGIAVHLGGGFHHAMPDAGLGFCVFNDVAVAIRRLRGRGFVEPVLVVDLDLHDGNGTRRIFADDPTVHTFSIHNDHWGDTEAVASTSIALGPGVGDARFLGTLREALPPVFEAVKPGLVVYLAGTDPAEDDPIGNWRLSAGALFERDRFVTSLARPDGRPCPMVVVLAGGYGRHAWRYSARYVLWLAVGTADRARRGGGARPAALPPPGARPARRGEGRRRPGLHAERGGPRGAPARAPRARRASSATSPATGSSSSSSGRASCPSSAPAASAPCGWSSTRARGPARRSASSRRTPPGSCSSSCGRTAAAARSPAWR